MTNEWTEDGKRKIVQYSGRPEIRIPVIQVIDLKCKARYASNASQTSYEVNFESFLTQWRSNFGKNGF